VRLHWASAEASCPLVWRLYLPRPWLEDPARAAEVRLPPGTVYRSKTELAVAAVDQALAWGLPPQPVVANAAYGNDFGFRQALRARQLHYAVQVEPTTVAWTAGDAPVAVGISVTRYPPPRSPRAVLPHEAPISDEWRQSGLRDKDEGRAGWGSTAPARGSYAPS
jgi:SRSO17 transposase